MESTARKLEAKSALLLLTLLLVGTPHGLRAQYLHPRLENGQKSFQRILVLPTKVNLKRDEIAGSSSMLKESEEIGAEITEMVCTTLREKRIGVDEPFSTLPQGNLELKYTLADIQKRYDRLEPLLLKKPKDIKRGRFSLGDDVARLDANALADALVFIRANGTKVTTGKKVYGVLVPGPSLWSKLSISLTVIDSKTGDVLYLARFRVRGNFVGEPRQALSASIHQALDALPGATLRRELNSIPRGFSTN